MFRLIIAAAAMIVAIAFNQPVRTEDADLIVKESAFDFATTVQRLQTEIEKRGAKIVVTVDHAAAAKATDGVDGPAAAAVWHYGIVGHQEKPPWTLLPASEWILRRTCFSCTA